MGRLTRRIQRNAQHADVRLMQQITGHIERHVGDIATVVHDSGPQLMHVDVHIVAPRPDRPFYTLVTTGMSSAPIKRRCEHGCWHVMHVELLMYLPPDWPVELRCGMQLPRRPEMIWPIRELKSLGEFPHRTGKWMGPGTTLSDGVAPFPGTNFTAVLLLPPDEEAAAFATLRSSPTRDIDFLTVWPLHPSELDFKRLHGSQALADRFVNRNVSPVVDVHRPPLA